MLRTSAGPSATAVKVRIRLRDSIMGFPPLGGSSYRNDRRSQIGGSRLAVLRRRAIETLAKMFSARLPICAPIFRQCQIEVLKHISPSRARAKTHLQLYFLGDSAKRMNLEFHHRQRPRRADFAHSRFGSRQPAFRVGRIRPPRRSIHRRVCSKSSRRAKAIRFRLASMFAASLR